MSTRKRKSKINNFSFLENLRKEGKITADLELLVSSLSLEDLISLKLELSALSLKGKMYGFPIWKSSFYIIKESLIKFAISFTSSQKEAANLLGLSLSELRRSVRQFKLLEEKEK